MRRIKVGLVALLVVATGEVRAAGEVERGQEIADKWCARCHVVGSAKPYGGIDSTPSFFIMNDKLDHYRQHVLALKTRPPHKALELDEVSLDDLEDVVAYIDSLERP